MNEEQILASDAKGFLENPVFKQAISAVETSLESQALSTDPDNKDKCARIIISKQILKGIIREIERFVEYGEVQDMIELEKRRKTMREKVFQR